MSEEISDTPTVSGKEFYSSGIIWSVIFILIPVFIWLGTKDWIVTLSFCTKIGVALLVFGLILLSCGVGNLTGSAAKWGGGHVRNKKGIQDVVTGQIFSAVSFAKIWITLFGLVYLLPLLFGIPFIL